ncbi:Unknown protein, partial [Striga hermonthica]
AYFLHSGNPPSCHLYIVFHGNPCQAPPFRNGISSTDNNGMLSYSLTFFLILQNSPLHHITAFLIQKRDVHSQKVSS